MKFIFIIVFWLAYMIKGFAISLTDAFVLISNYNRVFLSEQYGNQSFSTTDRKIAREQSEVT